MTSINRSICLYCKTSSLIDTEKEFHDIFDEVGWELQLPSLVEKFFGVNVKKASQGGKQLLCADCVDRLIDLFDLYEHTKEAGEDNAKGLEHLVQEDAEKVGVCSDNNEALGELTPEANNVEYVAEVSDIDTSVKDEFTDHQFYTQANHAGNEETTIQLDFADETESDEIPQQLVRYTESEHNMSNDKSEIQEYINVVDNDDRAFVPDVESGSHNNPEYEEVIVEEQYENIENQYYQLEEVPMSSTESPNFDEVSQEDQEYFEEYEEDNTADVAEENVNDKFIMIEEEYLIEETICSEEYDNVDLAEYLESAIITKFEELNVSWMIECKLCLETYNTFQELLKHGCVQEVMDKQRFCCILRDCEEVVNDTKSLARHLLTVHYENVESLPIYGRCPECQKTFSNIVDLNKHSCCVLKRKAGVRHFCQACNMDFQSQKRYVFHMQYHLTKHRPKICLLCGVSFNNVADFFEHVSYSHESESTMACIRCDRFFKDKAVYDRHIQSHESSTLFECTYCPKTYTNRCGLANHMEIYHNHKTKPLQCEYCNKEFVSQSSYRSHLKIHMPEANVSAFICSVCGLISSNSDACKKHIEAEEEMHDGSVAEIIEKIISVAYTCENCSLDYETAPQLHLHRQSSIHDSKLFYCPICRKTFRTLQHMRNHMTSHKDYDDWHNNFPIARFYMCDIDQCRDAYPLWTSLYYHKKRHKKTTTSSLLQEDDSFKCQFCQKLCPTKMSLAIHVARVHNNSHVKCPHCNKMYKTNKDLEQHVDHMHTSVKCTQCERLFKNRRNLRSHEQLVHKNEKRYFCRHCSKGYYYKSEMEAHEKNLHPQDSYKCKLCHFITNYSKSLDIHMARHNNKLPFKCSVCSKTFGRKQLLSVHEKRHQKHKEFVCYNYCDNGCEASFVTRFLLKKHIWKKHSEITEKKLIKQKAKRSKQNTSKHSKILLEDDNSYVELIVGDDDEDEINDDEEEDYAYQTEEVDDGNDEEYEIHYDYEDEDDLEDEEQEECIYENEDLEMAS